jgi:multidrug efflux pump
VFNWILKGYEVSLAFVLRHPFVTLTATVCTIVLTFFLYIAVPKTLFPQQDTGRLSGTIVADQSVSSRTMSQFLTDFVDTVSKDPAVENTVAFSGRGTANQASMFVALKPLAERKVSADQVIARLRAATAKVAGAELNFQAVQDLRAAGGRQSRSQYQYTLQADSFDELSEWAPKLLARLKTIPGIVDANSDQQNHGLQTTLVIDRATASRLGLSASDIDNLLYDAFGQRQVSTMYRALNQYHVVMEVSPEFAKSPEALNSIYARTASGTKIPLSAIAHFETTATPLGINHQGQFPSITLSFNLKPGFSLGTAVTEIQDAQRELGLPASIHGTFAGTAQAFQASLSTQPILLAAAILAVYIVLGILYESLVHPITILSTLPSAGVGALLALLLFQTDLSVIAMIGIILLIGIVKKNAIMMIDFALEAERGEGKSPRDAIFQAALLRFRPITMTTMAALLGGLPLALGTGEGAELRRPLGIAIVGGLLLSQLLTLYTTPVIYLCLDWMRNFFRGGRPEHVPTRHDDLTQAEGALT